MTITDSSRASTPTQGPSTTPLPTFPRRLMLFRSILSNPLGDAVEICLNFPTTRSIAALDEVWRAADTGGVGWIAVPDSPMILRDWVAAATYGLTRLDRIGVQIGVTNPVTRHPPVTANA